MERDSVFERLGLTDLNSGVYAGEWIERADADKLESVSPIDGSVLAEVTMATEEDYECHDSQPSVVAGQGAGGRGALSDPRHTRRHVRLGITRGPR